MEELDKHMYVKASFVIHRHKARGTDFFFYELVFRSSTVRSKTGYFVSTIDIDDDPHEYREI